MRIFIRFASCLAGLADAARSIMAGGRMSNQAACICLAAVVAAGVLARMLPGLKRVSGLKGDKARRCSSCQRSAERATFSPPTSRAPGCPWIT